jgi:hypothetical protein
METMQIEFETEVRNEKLHNEDLIVQNYKKTLLSEIEKIENGERKLYSFEQLDSMLEKTISRYES